ncbi:hypothetical protein ACMFMG_010292 [Clarireedia jacksonii]
MAIGQHENAEINGGVMEEREEKRKEDDHIPKNLISVLAELLDQSLERLPFLFPPRFHISNLLLLFQLGTARLCPSPSAQFVLVIAQIARPHTTSFPFEFLLLMNAVLQTFLLFPAFQFKPLAGRMK